MSTQRNLSGGELAPALYARTDVQKYQTGTRQMRNMFVQRHGGASNRAGTIYVAATKNYGAVRLVPFEYSIEKSYLLAFGDGHVRMYQNASAIRQLFAPAWAAATSYAIGDIVIGSDGYTYYALTAHTSAAGTSPTTGGSWQTVWYRQPGVAYAVAGATLELPTPYLVADLDALQFVQTGGSMRIVHQNYAPRELKVNITTGVWTIAAVTFGATVGGVTGLALGGGSAGALIYWAVSAVSATTQEEGAAVVISSTNRVPSAGTPTTLTWGPATGANSYNIYRSTDGRTYGLVALGGSTPLGTTDTTFVTAADSVTTTAKGSTVASGTQVRNALTITAATRATDQSYTVTGTITVSSSGTTGNDQDTLGSIRAYYSRDGEVRVSVGVLTSASVSGNSSVGPVDFSVVVMVPDNGYAALTIDLVPQVYCSTVDAAVVTSVCSITGAQVAWMTSAAGYTDVGNVADTAISPTTQKVVFNRIGQYPGVVGQYQQRAFYGNVADDPEAVYGSHTTVYGNFNVSRPIRSDDAVQFALRGRNLNRVKHLLDLGRLIVFTEQGEWIIEGDESGIIKPTAVNPRQYSYNGSGSLSPIVISDTALYVQREGSVVRDLTHEAIGGVQTNDLTLFATHLFEGYTLVDWAFQKTPHAMIYAVRSDGVMLTLTYVRDQGVWGWARHDTDGTFERVCTVLEGTEWAVYVVVKRTINGVTTRAIERFASRTITALTDVRSLVFMDSATRFDGRNGGANTMTVSGGAAWGSDELLTVTAASGAFTAADVGNAVVFFTATGVESFRITITAYTSTTVVQGFVESSVPVASRGVATTAWGRGYGTLTGLTQLEGKAVSVFGDGNVIASPKNSRYTTMTVTGGSVVIGRPAVVGVVGLPYLSDLETLDIDTASGPSIKPYKVLVNKVTLQLEKSRGFWAGGLPPVDDALNPLSGLDEAKVRDIGDAYIPMALRNASYDVPFGGSWNDNGRVFIRQPDPIPMTVLAIVPQGIIPPTG